MASTVFVGTLVLTKSTSVAAKVHPAVALALCLACLHGYCLLQGARVALPSLLRTFSSTASQHDDASLFQESHPMTFHLVTTITTDSRIPTAMSSFSSALETGAHTWMIAIIFVLYSILQQTEDEALITTTTLWGWSWTALTIATGFAMCVWISTMNRVAMRQASQCRLDWLNTPFMVFIWYACRMVDNVYDAVQIGLPLLWQRHAEKPTLITTGMTSQHGRFLYLRILLSALVLSIACHIVGYHLWKTQGIMGVVVVPSAMVAAGILPSANVAISRLSHRERIVALEDFTVEILMTNPQDDFLSVVCWTIVATLSLGHRAPASSTTATSYLVLLLCTVLTTTAVSFIIRAIAQSFPVAFLTHPITTNMLQVSHALRGFTHVAVLLPFFYQHDDVYIGTPQERQAYKVEERNSNSCNDDDDFADEESCLPKHIPSYPQPTDDATVILEEHEF